MHSLAWNKCCPTSIPHFRSGSDVRQTLSAVKTILMDDAGFWGQVDDLIRLMLPIMLLIRKVDGDSPVIGKVYNECFKVSRMHALGCNVSV